jgi:hypothetical protein
MEIKPFKDLKITTMTLIAKFEGKININPVFCLLPITKIELPPKKRNIKKLKIPHCKTPGSILSLRYRGCTRDIFRTTLKRHFRNSITMDISTSQKNISLKISETTIHMTGPTSLEQGEEAIYHLFRHIREIQENLDYMNERRDEIPLIVEWLIEATRGVKVSKTKKEIIPSKSVTLAVTEMIPDCEVRIPTDEEIETSGLDEKIIRFFLRQVPEFTYHSELCYDFENIAHLESVIDGELKCHNISKAMVNCNYHLNFKVNRPNLKAVFDSHPSNWCARYDPRLDHTVTIQIPYEVPEEQKFMRKPDKKHCHTFMVQKSGVVTQSGPDEQMMEQAYLEFMNIIQSNLHLISCIEPSNQKLFVKTSNQNVQDPNKLAIVTS